MIGQILLHYRIVEKIGEGGMGVVYRAVDTHLDRPVAIKILPPDKVADPERKQRFIREAKAASALRHPNIVVIHDIAFDGGRDFMVMEFVEGQSLDGLIGRKGLKLNEALGFAVQIADGLAKAHAAGIIHRDLKPTNVMVTADGLVKILDFGLAKLTENIPTSGAGATMTLDVEDKPRTEEGYIVGTAAYMSPEQAEGKKVDARSDVFSFGAALMLKFVVFKPAVSVEYEISPLTYDSGWTGNPTLSVDGNLMAFSSDRGDASNLDIWVRQLSGGNPLRLTDHPANDWQPSFSPDGSQVAFRSEREGGGIYVVIPPSLEQRHTKMYLVSSRGGEPRPFHHDLLPQMIGQGGGLTWSPDARYVLLCGRHRADPQSMDWWVAPVDGGEASRTRAVENLGLAASGHYPVGWTRDFVYFVAGTTIEGVNLFRAPIDPRDRTIRGPAEIITTGPGMKVFPAITSDGRVVFTNMTAAITSWSVSARADEAVILGDPGRLTQDLMQKFSPTITRDGSKAAFVAFGGIRETRYEIRVKDLRAGQETAFPMQGGALGGTVLSPDGSHLAYRDIVDGKMRTYVLAPGASAGNEICDGCHLLDFFPGNDFAVVRVEPGSLGKLNLREGDVTPLLDARGERILDARLSPDGTWIAWIGGRPDGRVMFRISPVDGPPGDPRETVILAEADHYLGSPAWSPNGRWLYFLSEKGDRTSLRAQELDPRTKKPVGPEREAFATAQARNMMNYPMGNGAIGVAEDRIIFSVTEISGNIYLAKPKTR